MAISSSVRLIPPVFMAGMDAAGAARTTGIQVKRVKMMSKMMDKKMVEMMVRRVNRVEKIKLPYLSKCLGF
jgi:hypothetical protein